jgi:hypothetical protein
MRRRRRRPNNRIKADAEKGWGAAQEGHWRRGLCGQEDRMASTINQKKTYVWRLAEFLDRHGMRMSGEELAEHLNRNNFVTEYGEKYAGGRGT